MDSGGGFIELRLRTAEQLYNSFDPSPFHERDLDESAERYIVGLAREVKGPQPLKLVVVLPEGMHNSETALQIPDAVHYYFRYRASQTELELRELLRVGRLALAIGLLVLALCVIAVQYLSQAEKQSTIVQMTEQSLFVLGWVANWRPLEIFLYEWWPIWRHRNLFRRLSVMPVEIKAEPAGR